MLDLTFGPSFKVKQWFTGFGELSCGGYKFVSDLRCVGLVLGWILMIFLGYVRNGKRKTW